MDLTGVSTPVLAGAVIFTGLVVVFIALVGLWGVVALMGKLFVTLEKPKPSAPSSGEKAAASPAPAQTCAPVQQATRIESGIGDEVVAVIAAAVAAMSGGTAVVRSVSRTRQRSARSNWAQAGVLQNTQQF